MSGSCEIFIETVTAFLLNFSPREKFMKFYITAVFVIEMLSFAKKRNRNRLSDSLLSYFLKLQDLAPTVQVP